MKLNARSFAREIEDAPFFLYVGFADCHRCDFEGANGSFCERYPRPRRNLPFRGRRRLRGLSAS